MYKNYPCGRLHYVDDASSITVYFVRYVLLHTRVTTYTCTQILIRPVFEVESGKALETRQIIIILCIEMY